MFRLETLALFLWHLLDQQSQAAVPHHLPPFLRVVNEASFTVVTELFRMYTHIDQAGVRQQAAQDIGQREMRPRQAGAGTTDKTCDTLLQQTGLRLKCLWRQNRQIHAAPGRVTRTHSAQAARGSDNQQSLKAQTVCWK